MIKVELWKKTDDFYYLCALRAVDGPEEGVYVVVLEPNELKELKEIIDDASTSADK